MLHVILLTIKILGIIILSILGLLLLVLLVCLFVPVAYRIQGIKHNKDMSGIAKAFWLILSVKASIDNKDKQVKIKIRILGIPIAVFQQIGVAIGKVCKGLASALKKMFSMFKRKERKVVEENIAIAQDESVKLIKEIEGDEVEKISEDVDKCKASEEKTQQDYDEEYSKIEKSKKGIWQRSKVILIKIYYFPRWIYEKILKIYLTIREFCGKIKRWKEFLTGDNFKRALRFALNKGNLLRKHTLPRKIKGHITFGFEEPSFTGQTLAALSMIAPLYKGKFKVVPMFNQKILEGDIDMRGHVFGITLVQIAWSIYRNKDVKEVIHHFNQKEA